MTLATPMRYTFFNCSDDLVQCSPVIRGTSSARALPHAIATPCTPRLSLVATAISSPLSPPPNRNSDAPPRVRGVTASQPFASPSGPQASHWVFASVFPSSGRLFLLHLRGGANARGIFRIDHLCIHVLDGLVFSAVVILAVAFDAFTLASCCLAVVAPELLWRPLFSRRFHGLLLFLGCHTWGRRFAQQLR